MKEANKKRSKARGLYRHFESPVKGILDIALIMVIITLAVLFLGPVIIEPLTQVSEQEPYVFQRPEKDYLIDEQGNVYGHIDIEFHDNGAFRQITEHNERDGQIVKVFYSEDNEFLYWIEMQFGENGEIISSQTFSSDGSLINN